MKNKLFLVLLLMLNNSIIFSQGIIESPVETSSTRVLTIQQFRDSVYAGSRISIGEIEKYSTPLESTIKFIYDRNVFEFYNSLKDYNTPLKQEMYKKTIDYSVKQHEIDSIRKGLFYMKVRPYGLFGRDSKWEYSLSRKGFEVQLTENTISGHPAKCLEVDIDDDYKDFWIQLKGLPTYKVRDQSWSSFNIWKEYFLINVNEEQGLELEELKDQLNLYIITILGPKEKIKYQWVNTGRLPFENVITDESVVAADFNRLVLINENTGKVYFDKTYKYTKINK